MNFIFVALGGFFGSIARFYLSIKMNRPLIGTWLANLSGSILLGFVVYFYLHELFTQSLWLFFGIGFCGAYTTFSTFSHETLQLLINKKYKAATIYVLSSLTLSIISIWFVLILF